MTICHIVASLDPRHGGPSKAVRTLAQAQAQLGNRVELMFGADQPSVQTEGNLTARGLRRGWPSKLCPLPDLARTLDEVSPEIIHAHGIWLRPLHIAHRASVAHRVPLVLSPRGMMSPWAWRHHRWRKAFAQRYVHPGAFSAVAGWHATSAEEAQDIRDLGFIQPVCVSPSGIETPSPDSLESARAHWQQVAPSIRTRRTALFYSRFHSKKRILELIDLWLQYAPADWILLIVGIPEQYSVRDLRGYIYRASGADRIEVYDGADQPAPYAAASLCLLPSHSENFGLVVAEALAAGIPALVTDSTPWKPLSAEGAGWCIPWADYGRTLQIALSESPEELARRGERAQRWAQRAFSWQVGARMLEAFYGGLRRAQLDPQ